jgi:alkylation response protein AidB-like acyl-CoA dehydrogenase
MILAHLFPYRSAEAAMPATRILPTEEAADLIGLTRTLAAKELAPRVAEAEADGTFPREVFRTLGRSGLLGLPFAEEHGGAGQPYAVYLQVLEEIAAVWTSVAVGVSVHALSCLPLARFGTDEQRSAWLPEMLAGELLGAYCLSEPHAGSDPAALRTRAVRDGGDYVINGTKAWTTHGGHADFYTVMARTSDDGGHGISCFLVPAGTPGLSADPPERKMGLTGSATATMHFEDVRVPAARRIGVEGQGLKIALASLDCGRLGIAAVATGLAQGALDHAVRYARERETFGKPIIEHQGLAFVLADMSAAIESARATAQCAARLKDRELPFTREASIAKLVATDNAMKVTTDAVQVLGGYGYTRDFPVERYMREAKVMQIFEGTNQIQRLVISRALDRDDGGALTVVGKE